MVAVLAPVPVFRAFDTDGFPLAGGLLYSYAAGTSTPKATYTDHLGTTPNTNPVVLDPTGAAQVWLDGSYKLLLTDADGVTQPGYPVDNITSIGGTGSTVLSGAYADLPAGAEVGTLYNVTDNVRGLFLKLATGWVPLNNRIITPELFGAIGDRVADDTGAMQACINYAKNNHLLVEATGQYRITATITFPSGAGYGFLMSHYVTFSPTPCGGFYWDGPADTVAIEVNEIQGCWIGSLMFYNLADPPNGQQPRIPGVTAVLWRSLSSGARSANNIFGRLGIFGAYIGLQIGDETGQGFPSNTEESVMGDLHFLGVQNPIIVDSLGLDQIYMNSVKMGPPVAFTDTGHLREHLIWVKAMGGGWSFGEISSRADGVPLDNAAIRVDSGHFKINQCRIENTGSCRLLDFNSPGGQYQSVVNSMFAPNHVHDADGIAVKVTSTGSLTLRNCNLPGHVSAINDNVIIENCAFWETGDNTGIFFGTTGAGRIAQVGIKHKLATTGAIVDDYEGGDLILGRLFVNQLTGVEDLTLHNLTNFSKITAMEGLTASSAIMAHNTSVALGTYVLTNQGDSCAIELWYNLWLGNGVVIMNAHGVLRWVGNLDNAGNVLTSVAGGFTIAPRRVEASASSSQTVFPYGFYLGTEEDLLVSDNGVVLSAADYSVSGLGGYAGGNVTFSVGRTAGHVIILQACNYNPLVHTALAYDSAEYQVLWLQPSVTVSGSGPYTLSLNATQFNTYSTNQHTALRIAGIWRRMNSNGTGAALNTTAFTNNYPVAFP